MSRYESGQGSTRKFWEITVTGNQLHIRYGRVGSDGRVSDSKEFDTEAAARKGAAKRIAAKRRQGFEPVDDDTSGLAVNPELRRAILENPDDDGPYLVYSDWLQSQGDARAELCIVQQQLEAHPDDDKLKKSRSRLMAKLAPTRLYKLTRKKRSVKKIADSGYSELVWRHGFIDRARVAKNSERPPYTVRELVGSLLAHPSAQVLRSLTIGALGVKGRYDYQSVVDEIRLAAPSSLRELVLADFDGTEHADLSASELGDVSGLYPVLPRLETLHLRAGLMDVGEFALPCLRSLTITTGRFEERTLRAIADASWPELSSLRLGSGGAALPITGLAHISVSKGLRALRSLSLMGTEDTGDLWRTVLRDSVLLSRLRQLDLSGGSLTDQTVEDMLAYRHQLEHLQRLNLDGNYMSEQAAASLVGICPDVSVADQRPPGKGRLILTDQQIREFAPDQRSLLAARKVALPAQWPQLGSEDRVLWGRCQGSTLYDVYMDVENMESGCTCPSQKYPCKHAIGLLILAQSHPIPDDPLPPGFIDEVDYDSIWE